MQKAAYVRWPVVASPGREAARAVTSTAVIEVPSGSSEPAVGGLATVQSWAVESVYLASVAKIWIAPVADPPVASTTDISCRPLPTSWQGTIDLSCWIPVTPVRLNSRVVTGPPVPGVKVEVPT